MRNTTLFVLLLIGVVATSTQAQYSASNRFLSLTGSGYISVPYSNILNYDLMSAGSISIDAWIRPTASGSQMTIVGNDIDMGYWFGLTAQGKLRFHPNPSMSQESNASIQLNVWTHVAVSFSLFQNTMVFYINGAVDRTITIPQSYLGNGYFDFRIGADRTPNGPAYYWVGGIDEVRVWAAAINFSTAQGLLYKIPHGMVNGLHGTHLKGGWRLNGNAASVGGMVNGSTVGTLTYALSPDPPFYSRIAVVLSNGPDATDHITVPNSPALQFTVNYTLECWVRPTSGGNTQFQTFISKGSYTAQRYQFWLGLNKSNGRVRFIPTGNWNEVLENTSQIPLNTWTHVAARLEQSMTGGRTATLFINGVEAGSRSITTAANANSDPMFFGGTDIRAQGNLSYGFSGMLDEVRIWNVPRSDDAIADHHRMELNGPMPGLVAAYHFDGDDFDASGNGIHGSGSFNSSSVAWFTDASSLPSQPTLDLVVPTGGERWEIGSNKQIQWNASGLINVRLELSTDGGSTFPTSITPSTAAAAGQYDWVVSGPVTNNAVIRIRPVSTILLAVSSKTFSMEDPTPILDVSPRNLVFNAEANGPAPPPQYIHLRNIGGSQLSWTATPNLGLWLSAQPASGNENVDSIRVEITDTQLPVSRYGDRITIGGNAANAGLSVDITLNIVLPQSYTVSGAVRSPTGAPVEGVRLKISGPTTQTTESGPDGSYSISGLPTGEYTLLPDYPYYGFDPPSVSFMPLSGDESDVDFVAMTMNGTSYIRYEAGWNLISLPFPIDQAVPSLLFPHATSSAYEYQPEMGYVEAGELEYGKGYWLKFSKSDSVAVSGPLAPLLRITARGDFGGWNLIGAPSGPVHIADISQSPTASLLSVYGYDPDQGYVIPPDGVIRPGHGYFIKVSTTAVLRLIAAMLAAPMYQPDW